MPIKVLAFSGSSRAGSLNGRLLDLGIAQARSQGAEVTKLDLRALGLPLYDGDLEAASGLPPAALELKQLIATHDALLIASPEYNGFFTPLLKNAIDWASRPVSGQASPFAGRVAALLAATPGALGGIRGLPATRLLLNNLGVLVAPAQMALPRADQAFDDSGLTDAAAQRMLATVVDELLAIVGKLR